VNTDFLKSKWVWLIAGLAVSLLLMRIFPGSFFLLLPFLGFMSFGQSKPDVSRGSAATLNRDRQPSFSRSTDVQNANTKLISKLVEHYNAQDYDGVAACFAADVQEFSHGGELLRTGPEAIAANYKKLFAEFPENRADVMHRSAFGDKVFDHERVRRSSTHDAFEVVVIYTIKDGAIIRTDYVR
jgi:hypothetical protein